MIRKITYLISFILLLSVILNFTYNSPTNNKYKTQPMVIVNDDQPRNSTGIKHVGSYDAVNDHKQYTTTYSDTVVDIMDVFTGEKTYYDLQSNAVTQQCVQSVSGDTIHTVLMQNLTSGIPSADRRTIYIVSTDAGATWTSLGAVGTSSSVPSGYAAIYLTDDGRAVVGDHSNEGPTGVSVHPTIYHDIAPAIGVWNLCDPGGVIGVATTRVWLRFAVTSSGKVPYICAYNPSAPVDTMTWTNVLTNPQNCTFAGYQVQTDMDNAEQYSMERAANGTIGIAYITNDTDPQHGSDVHYITSTDEGLNWSTPTVVYDCTPNPDNYLGAARGVDLVYTGNTPNICFAVMHETNAGTYYPGMNGRIYFWNPTVNGGNYVTLADSTVVPDHPIISSGAVNDVYVSISRCTIGKSRNEAILYCTFSVARAEVSPLPDSTPYMDVYLAWSNDHGATWNGYDELTNLSAPPYRDCRYACLAPINDYDQNYYYANLTYVNDSIPGSTLYGTESLAEFHFIRVKLPGYIGVKNIGYEVPRSYALNQNYPNPFNPSTKITFELPKSELVVLKVYDVIGREVAVLVNEKLSSGKKEYEFNAVNLPSGVYFYTINAGDFKATRKMVLVK